MNKEKYKDDLSKSVLITGKCKEEFLNFYWKNYIGKTRFLNEKTETDDFFHSLYPTFKNALILDFFDSVGVYIAILPIIYQNEKLNCFQVEINNKIIGHKTKQSRNFDNRTDALLRAIEMTNEIFNAKVV